MNEGMAQGGPADGKVLKAETKRLVVPIQTGPNRGEGDRGFSEAPYEFEDGKWIYKGD